MKEQPSSNERPIRDHYGVNEDLAFNRDLVTWQYGEIERLREQLTMWRHYAISVEGVMKRLHVEPPPRPEALS